MTHPLLLAAALLLPLPALAHTGGGQVDGLVSGFLHPIGGLDHLVAMIAVGLWAGVAGGAASWLLPAGFLGGMAVGALIGMGGIEIAMVESGILASVIVLGALLAAAVTLPRTVALPLVALFGLLHGHAHGTEMAGGAVGYAAGFLLATALLHAAGVVLAAPSPGWRRAGLRIAGAAAAAVASATLLIGG